MASQEHLYFLQHERKTWIDPEAIGYFPASFTHLLQIYSSDPLVKSEVTHEASGDQQLIAAKENDGYRSNGQLHCINCDEVFNIVSNYQWDNENKIDDFIKFQCSLCLKIVLNVCKVPPSQQQIVNVKPNQHDLRTEDAKKEIDISTTTSDNSDNSVVDEVAQVEQDESASHAESQNNKTIKHQCEHCGKVYQKPSHLLRHIRVHTGEKPFNCTDCGKCFSQSSNLRTHMLSHSGEKTSICTACGKSFYENRNLQRHMLTHSGEKRFTCTVCNKAFSLNNNLKKHLMLHTGERPHVCEQCGKRFVHKHHLTRHMETHHKD